MRFKQDIQLDSQMPRRTYTLSLDKYHGEVAGVQVSYVSWVEQLVRGTGNSELKRFLEDAAVKAALSRGLSPVVIRSK